MCNTLCVGSAIPPPPPQTHRFLGKGWTSENHAENLLKVVPRYVATICGKIPPDFGGLHFSPTFAPSQPLRNPCAGQTSGKGTKTI